MARKVALVIGGSTGIGRATALAFARSGARVVIASRRQATAEGAMQALQAMGGEAVWVPTDVTNAAQVHALVHRTIAAREYIRQSVRINAICPGWMRTAPVERRIGRSPDVAREILGQEPIGHLGTPEEVAEAVLWLCSEQATLGVGASIAVDGGYLA